MSATMPGQRATGDVRRRRNDVVRPLARAAARPCARPGCPSPAVATLGFCYASREAWLASLVPDSAPETYDLCAEHAGRTRPPHGWKLTDRRPAAERRPPGTSPTPDHLGSDDTVAVLAAALRVVPDPDPLDLTPQTSPSDPGNALAEAAAMLSELAGTRDALSPGRPVPAADGREPGWRDTSQPGLDLAVGDADGG